ncbi:unnamed protein product [Arctogadus glacialis]
MENIPRMIGRYAINYPPARHKSNEQAWSAEEKEEAEEPKRGREDGIEHNDRMSRRGPEERGQSDVTAATNEEEVEDRDRGEKPRNEKTTRIKNSLRTEEEVRCEGGNWIAAEREWKKETSHMDRQCNEDEEIERERSESRRAQKEGRDRTEGERRKDRTRDARERKMQRERGRQLIM